MGVSTQWVPAPRNSLFWDRPARNRLEPGGLVITMGRTVTARHSARRSGAHELKAFSVDLVHALESFDVLGHAGIFAVEVIRPLELVEAGLGHLPSSMSRRFRIWVMLFAELDQTAEHEVPFEPEAGYGPP